MPIVAPLSHLSRTDQSSRTLLEFSMKNLYVKYVLLGLWLICESPCKKALVRRAHHTAGAINSQNQQSTELELTANHHLPKSISPSFIQTAYQSKLHLAEYSDSPMIYLNSWKPQIKGLNHGNSSFWVRNSYLNSTYLLRLSGHKNRQFNLAGFTHS